MTITAFFFRFTLVYLLAMAAAGVAWVLIQFSNPSALNTPILLAVAYWCFYSYSMKNGRVVGKGEKWKLAFTALAGDIAASVILATPTVIVDDIPLRFVAFGMLIVVPLHLLALLGVNFLVRKQLVKQYPGMAESAAPAPEST